MLARDIRAAARQANQSSTRRGVNNRSCSLLEHLENFTLYTHPHPLEIDGDEVVPTLLGTLDRGGRGPFDARIIMRTIQPSIGGDGCVDQRRDLRGLRDISSDKEGL